MALGEEVLDPHLNHTTLVQTGQPGPAGCIVMLNPNNIANIG
jgi:hypothetical protein